MEKLIIAVGLNENVTREQNPNVPITPDEIAEDIAACVDAGASVIHLHARDPKTGEPRMNDPAQYLDIFRAIQRRVDVPCYPTYPTWSDCEERYQHVVALAEDPDCSLEVAPVIGGTTNLGVIDREKRQLRYTTGPGESVLFNPYGYMAHHLEFARKHDLWVSHDIFEPGMVRNAIAFWEMGAYQRPMLLKFFMAENHAFGFPPEIRYLETLVSLLPEELDCEWLFLPFGVEFGRCWEISTWCIENGGHVRVGVGDNPSGPGYLPTNAERVHQIAEASRERGRAVASVTDVRTRFAPLAH
ncbi:MAG: 3-keto-5-aminohexanoate cleavage protein [Myxococcales bacterium]|nr:3-keto-5-aminohexanoate cleavage protein [Myxococcales bacterium]